MTISRRKLLAGSALLLLAGTGLAQEPAGADAAADAEPRAERERLRQHRENMSDEERQAMRERRRAECESLSDEERTVRRAQMGQRRGEMRERWNNRSDALRECIRKLPVPHHRLIALRYYEEQSIDEVAEKVGRTTTAVYRALSRIRKVV